MPNWLWRYNHPHFFSTFTYTIAIAKHSHKWTQVSYSSCLGVFCSCFILLYVDITLTCSFILFTSRFIDRNWRGCLSYLSNTPDHSIPFSCSLTLPTLILTRTTITKRGTRQKSKRLFLPNLHLCSPGFLDHPASPLLHAVGLLVFLPPQPSQTRGVLHGYIAILAMVQACHMFIEYILNQN
jgi:hypothetical protein